MKIQALTITFAACLFVGFSAMAADVSAVPRAGDKAPPVEGKDQDGKDWKLSDELGKKIVLLYFYPKDDTPGCTKEACGFRDSIEELKQDNVEVIGVSFDSGESHLKFISKYNLNFPLLADMDGKIADTFGVRMAGKPMARRVSFLIGLDGKISAVIDSPKAEVHVAAVKAAVTKPAAK
jgi:peroxiredoxin Q/BCP